MIMDSGELIWLRPENVSLYGADCIPHWRDVPATRNCLNPPVSPKYRGNVTGFLALTFALLLPGVARAWHSTLYPTNWQPPTVTSANFATDKLLQDFSYAGYQAGENALPHISGPVFTVTLPPFNADNTGVTNCTTAIQSAINTAQSAGGGVVFLPAGLYAVSPQGANTYALQITSPNVVLRGAGISNTFLLNTSTNMRSKSIILISGPSGAGFYSSGTGSSATTQDLLGPTLQIPVASTAGFAVGQWVTVRADCSDAWVTEHGEPDWLGYSNQLRGIAYFRRVVAVSNSPSTITINAPTRYYLKTRDNARVVRLSSAPLLNCGLEDFSIGNVQHNGTGWAEDDYNISGTGGYDVHDSFAIRIVRARDSWVRNVATFQPAGNTFTCHLLSNGILLNECSQITLTNCHFQRSQYGGAGGNGYLYRLQNVNECLLDNCRSTFTRHGFVLSHMGASGNVFHECVDKDTGRQTGNIGSQTTAGANSDHHMHFSHANLVDACTADGSSWEARYRPYGSAPLHNLTAAHSVYWNTHGIGSGPTYAVQTEQSRYGYAIGTRGTRTSVLLPTYGGTKCTPLDHVEGSGLGETLEPFSLYQDQLNRRLNRPQILLPATITLTFPTNSFRLTPTVMIGSRVAATNEYTATWRVVSAPGLGLFSNTNSAEPLVTFADRGTNELELTVIANGQPASARIAVILSPDFASSIQTLAAQADTYVRDGSFSNDNYGAETVLQLKKNATTGFTRRAFLRFQLPAGGSTNFDRAYLELRSSSPPPPGTSPTLELHLVTTDGWSETGVNWSTQPLMGQTLASWPMSTNGLDRVEVSAAAANEANTDGQLSLGLLIANPFSDTVYSLHAREAGQDIAPRLVLETTNSAPSYSAWAASFVNQPLSDPAGNLDGDRYNNAEEYLFAINPTQSDVNALISVAPTTGGVLLTFPQRKRLPAGTYYSIEHTGALVPGNWLPAPGVVFTVVADLGEAQMITAFVPSTSPQQAFLRLRIVLGQ